MTKRVRPIICLNTGDIFDSVSDAVKKLDISDSYIRHVLLGHRKHAKGMVFEYYDSRRLHYYQEKKEQLKYEVLNHIKPVICLNTGDVYDSIIDASRKMKIPYSSIYDSLYGYHKCTKDGYSFQFFTLNKQCNKVEMQEKALLLQKRKKEVKKTYYKDYSITKEKRKKQPELNYNGMRYD